MSKTPILQIPLLEAAQSQKHVTHNEALMALDVLTMPAVKDRHLTSPPGSPAEGDRYIVAGSATGAWSGKELQIAAFQDGVWIFYLANTGWAVWVEDETAFYVFDGSAWLPGPSGGGVTTSQLGDGSVTKVGVNAAADDTNKLSVNSDTVLFNHNGSGAQVKVNKNLATDTGSHLFQTNFSGRAEFGLTGSDDFQIKVSSDGSNWTDAITIDRGTGIVTFHQGTVGDNGGPGGPIEVKSVCNGRLTLESGVPVTTSDQIAKTVVYFTPYNGNQISLYDGVSAWTLISFSELSIKLTDTQSGTTTSSSAVVTGLTDTSQFIVGVEVSGTGIPAGTSILSIDSGTQVTLSQNATVSGSTSLTFKVVADTNLDIWAFDDAGNVKLEMTAWSNDTVRAVALAMQDGIYVKAGAVTRRYLGTVRTTITAGQTVLKFGGFASGGSNASLLVWNMYGRVRMAPRVRDSDNNWSYSSSTIRPYNNSTANRISFVYGVAEDHVVTFMNALMYTSAASRAAGCGIALDSTNTLDSSGMLAFSSGSSIPQNSASTTFNAGAQLGFHYLQAVEVSWNDLEVYFYGDGGSGHQGDFSLEAELWM